MVAPSARRLAVRAGYAEVDAHHARGVLGLIRDADRITDEVAPDGAREPISSLHGHVGQT